MIGEWQLVQGNEMPEPFSIRDDKYAVLTKNVEQIDDDLYQYEEFMLKKEDYDLISGATDNSFTEVDNALIETYDIVDGNVTNIEQINDALIELYEMVIGG